MASDSISRRDALDLLNTWMADKTPLRFVSMFEREMEFCLNFRCEVFSVSWDRVTLLLIGMEDVLQFSLAGCRFRRLESLEDMVTDHLLYSMALVAERETGHVFLFMQSNK